MQAVGGDFADHVVSATVTGLVPNAVYHVHLVASNKNGQTTGLDVAFATKASRTHFDRVGPALVRLGLTGRLAGTPAAKLSTGQRRRTALAVLVARNPALWLLDEPHAGLDAEGRALVDELIGEASAAGATVVLVTHEPASVPCRTVTMAGGAIVAAASQVAHVA